MSQDYTYHNKSRESDTPRFQRRHYESVAKTLKMCKNNHLVSVRPDTQVLWKYIVLSFAAMFRQDNALFRSERFIQACGYVED